MASLFRAYSTERNEGRRARSREEALTESAPFLCTCFMYIYVNVYMYRYEKWSRASPRRTLVVAAVAAAVIIYVGWVYDVAVILQAVATCWCGARLAVLRASLP